MDWWIGGLIDNSFDKDVHQGRLLRTLTATLLLQLFTNLKYTTETVMLYRSKNTSF